MRYLSVCAGIEAATVAWHPLGWTPAAFSEIEAFPRAVLRNRWPEVPLHGDFTKIAGGEYGPVDLVVGGTPCQAFSVAGLRRGFADHRGNLTLGFVQLLGRVRPRWVVWENVPGVLSLDGGRAFGAFLGGLAECGYGFAYRVLDAQYFGLAQRRARVFVVGHFGDWRRAAAVLFEPESLRGDPPPRREAGERVAGTLAPGAHPGGFNGRDADTADTLIAPTFIHCNKGRPDGRQSRHTAMVTLEDVVPTLATDGHAGSAVAYGGNNTAGPIDVATAVNAHGGPHGRLDFESETFIAFSAKDHGADAGDLAPTLRAMGHAGSHPNAGGQVAVAYGIGSDAVDRSGEGRARTAAARSGLNIVEDCQPALRARQNNSVAHGTAVRRLTPRECERLQGFPDDYTLIPWRKGMAADGPRYKALGNSMAVPVMRWIGERIAMVERIGAEIHAAA